MKGWLALLLATIPLLWIAESIFTRNTANAAMTLRLVLWRDTLEIISQHQWFGVGWGQLNFVWTLTPLSHRAADVFVEVVRSLMPGALAPTLLRSGAGFHVLKLLERQEGGALSVQQTHARHILLRVSQQLPAEAAGRRLAEFKRQIVAGAKSFEQLARENSEDGSAAGGGDLGWASPGTFVPEFEETMNALPVNGISEPLASRFGVHLIQVLERRQVALDLKQQRDQARNVLREQKFEGAYLDWVRDLRGRAYVELREPPQ